jgi:uncharacterized membrane protein
MAWILPLHLINTAFLLGLAWFTQLVVYPLFLRVGANRFPSVGADYLRRAAGIVAPLMIVEAILTLTLLAAMPTNLWMLLGWLNFGLLLYIVCSTFFVQIPQHELLTQAFHETRVRRLMRGSWPRTAVWTLRLALLIVLGAASNQF